MDPENARQLATAQLEKLAVALEAGQSDSLREFLAAMARFHRYSPYNVWLILSQRPTASRVAGFQTWKQFGRFVKRGERGIVILAPMFFRHQPKEENDCPPEDEEPTVRFRAVHVFDVSQTEGDPLPEPTQVTGDPGAYHDRLKSFVCAQAIELTYADNLGSADGMSSGGRITLRIGLSKAEEFTVLVHELAHELLHRGEKHRLQTKKVRETEAEAVAFVVASSIGLETGTAASDYIQLYGGDKATLAASLERIQQTAALIIDALAKAPDSAEGAMLATSDAISK